jgi:hypothetical protein
VPGPGVVGPGISQPGAGGGGSGTVTSVSVVSANGLAGTVATPTTTPAITLSTSVTGILKGNGTTISAATAGTDYPATGVISAGGPTGSGVAVPVITWNANGQLTAVTTSATVGTVAATDTSIVVGGTATAPTIATGTLDVIATQHPAAADWSNNSHKITSLANGSAAQDAAAFGQIPTTLPPFTTSAISATGNSVNKTFELVTTAASTITRTLPAPTANAIIGFKKIDAGAGTVVITQHAAETIDGAATFTISTRFASVQLISDGTNWFIF